MKYYLLADESILVVNYEILSFKMVYSEFGNDIYSLLLSLEYQLSFPCPNHIKIYNRDYNLLYDILDEFETYRYLTSDLREYLDLEIYEAHADENMLKIILTDRR